MAHTPTVPADERAMRFLERAEVDEPVLARLRAVVGRVQALAQAAGATDKLQAEFGSEHVALIHDCNQFLRVHKRGDAAGRVELYLPELAKQALQEAGFTLHPPIGQVFRLFGWVAVEPRGGPEKALDAAVAAAYARARG